MSGPRRTVIDSEAIAARLARLEAVDVARRVLGEQTAWIVGGAVRDAVLGRESEELDLAVAGDPGRAARAIGQAAAGPAFELSGEHGTWRVLSAGGEWRVDLTRLRGDDIEEDLAARDFTCGALAVPLTEVGAGQARIIDPFGGIGDLEAGILRVVAPRAFDDDPLRLLRAARFAATLGLEIEEGTLTEARARSHRAAEPAGERQLEELRLLFAGPDPVRGIGLTDALGCLEVIMPEVVAMRGVEQGSNHHLDVYDHTLAVLEGVMRLEDDPGRLLSPDRLGGPDRAAAAVRGVRDQLAEPLAAGMTRAVALRLGALFHDLGKPATRVVHEEHIGFPGHDRVGSELIAVLGRRLAMGNRLRRYLQDMSLHHLALGFMAARGVPTEREIHAYLRTTGDVAVDVTLLTVADRLAARGSGSLAGAEMIEGHLGVAALAIERALAWRAEGPPRPLLRGDEIARELGIDPGPELGGLTRELEAAQYAGEVRTRSEAIDHLRRSRDT